MQKIFYFWWIHTARTWLFGCSKSLESPLICLYLVLSSWGKEKVLCFKFHFRMYFFPSTLLISVCTSFLSCNCLETSFELTQNLKSTKGSPLFTTMACVNQYAGGLFADSKGCPMSRLWTWLPLSLPLTDMPPVNCTGCDDLCDTYIAIVPGAIDWIEAA